MTIDAKKLVEIQDDLDESKVILIVEDDVETQYLIADIVKGQGYRVLLACDGQHALDLMGLMAPSLVMADIRMPKMDGIELAENIKKSHPNIPVILFSGVYPNLILDRIDKKIKADHVLYKPFCTEDVLESLKLFL